MTHRPRLSGDLLERRVDDVAMALLDGTPVAMYAKDLNLRFVLTNPTHTSFIGLTRDAILGRTDGELFGEEADTVEATSREVIASGQPSVQEIELTLPDGPHTFLEVIFPILGEGDAPIGVGGLATDITVRRRLEVALAERAAELERTLAELRRTRDQLMRQHERAALVSQCVELLQISGSVEECMTVLAQFAPRLIPSARVTIYQVDPETGSLCLRPQTAPVVPHVEGSMVEVMERHHCWALRTRRVHRSSADRGNPTCRHVDPTNLRATFCMPITSLGGVVALLVIDVPSDAKPALDEEDVGLFHAQAVAIAQSLSGGVSTVALRESLQRAALSDESTQLPNLRAFQQEGARTVARQRRAGRTYALAVVRASERVGYIAAERENSADEIPRRVADVLRVGLRESDLIGRIAPDEFAVLMTDVDNAVATDRIAALSEQIGGVLSGSGTITVRCSVVHSLEAPDRSLESLLSLARQQI